MATTSAPPDSPLRRLDGVVRVASIPASHVYVRHLADPDGDDGVVRLADVPPADGRTVPGGWWPPVMLDAAWIREHLGTFDVFHVHFGFDAKDPDELRDVVDVLDEHGVPLVVTVHDLRNPHHDDPRLHEEQLSVLVRSAAVVVTLTTGAAARIRERWGRTARVVPHPHVVEPGRMRRPRARRSGFVVGVHAKSLRANMDVVPVARVLADVVSGLPGAALRIDMHDELLHRDGPHHAPDVVAELRALGDAHPAVDVRMHGYFTDDELWDYLASLDASVLPYRFGTHSGWLEACHDLGTTVIAPDCGHYAEQGARYVFGHDERRFDEGALRHAVIAAYGDREGRRRGCAHRDLAVERRLDERRAVAAAHRRIYADALAGRGDR